MYTSVTDRQRRRGLRYLAAAILVAAAGGVYEYFSHGVMSNYMIFAFMVPLLAGAVPNLLASFAGDKKRADSGSSAAAGLQLAAAATLTAGSLVNGALEIYGTTNRLMIFYPVAGLALLTAALAAYVLQDRRLSTKPSEQGRI